MHFKNIKDFFVHEAEVFHIYPADLKKYMRRLIGIISALISYFFFALSNVLTKFVSEIPMSDIMFWRYFAIFVIAIVYFLYTGEIFKIYKTNVIKKHFARGFFGYVNSYLTIVAMLYLPVADASSLSYTHGLFMIFLTPFFLKERVSLKAAFYVMVGFIGVLIISNPEASNFNFKGTAYGLLAGICLAFSVMYVKVLSISESVKTTLFYFAVFTFVIAILHILVSGSLVWNFNDIIISIIIGAIAAVAQVFLTVSIFCVSPTTTAIVSYSSMIWTSILGYLIWSEIPSINFYIGSAFILYAGIASSLRKLKSAKQN